MSTKKAGNFTAKKAMFLNSKDGLMIRSATFKNKKKYDRKNYKKNDWE